MDFSDKTTLFNHYLDDIEVPLIRAFDLKCQSIEGINRLTLGQPDFPTPEHIKDAAKKALDDNFTGYTHSAGDIRLREAAASFVKKKYNLDYDPATEVITTVGATEALTTALHTIINKGDKILIAAPYFSIYKEIVHLGGGIPVFIDTAKNNFVLSPEMIEEAMAEHSDQVKGVLLNYPTNPTGVTWTAKECQAIAETMKQYPDVFVISDEIYSELVYEGHHVSMGEYLREQSIIINGLSKSHSMTGWRIGFTFAPAEITTELQKIHQYMVTSTTSIAQAGAIEALTNGLDDAEPMKAKYKERRDYILAEMEDMGFTVAKPNGAFYLYAKIPAGYIQDSYEFVVDLAEKAKVAVVPGIAFGDAGEGYIRISYAASLEQLKEAMERIRTYMDAEHPAE